MEDDQVQLELDETGKSEEWYRVGGKAGGRIRRLGGYHYTTLHWGVQRVFFAYKGMWSGLGHKTLVLIGCHSRRGKVCLCLTHLWSSPFAAFSGLASC